MWKPCFVISVALLTPVLAAEIEQEPNVSDLYKKLHIEAEAESAFLNLCSVESIKTKGDKKRLAEWIEGTKFKSCSFSFARQASGTEIAIGKLEMTYLVCGNGLYDGGIKASSDLPVDTAHNGYIFIEDTGKPLLLVEQVVTRMAVLDTDGGGQANTLVRWADWTDYQSPPFLIIHDLTKPGFPAMINLMLNPKAGIDRVQYSMKADTLEVPLPSVDNMKSDPPKIKEPVRTGRWSFVKRDKFRDILIEEKKGNKFVEVAVFKFDPDERLWKGPAGSDDDFWKVGTDDHFRATFTDLRSKITVFKKYDPKK